MSKFPRPMLAENVTDFSALKFPKLASPKIDGIRATMHGGVLRSRSLKDIPNVHIQAKFKGIPDGVDGELVVGEPNTPETYDRTRRVVMESGKRTTADDVRWFIFDRQTSDCFEDRLAHVYSLKLCPKYDAIVIAHRLITDLDQLQEYEQAMLDKGFEGVMLRDPRGPYKHGRSSEKEGWLVKVKRFTDAEARVISCYEEMGNHNEAFTNEVGRTARSAAKAGKVGNNTLGGFHTVGVNGRYKDVEFDVAVSSLTHDKRHDIWDARETQVGRIFDVQVLRAGERRETTAPNVFTLAVIGGHERMTQPDISKWSLTQSVREVTCPRCNQPAGSYCKTPAGRSADSTHGERSGAYFDKIGREEWDKRHTGSMASSGNTDSGLTRWRQ